MTMKQKKKEKEQKKLRDDDWRQTLIAKTEQNIP
jgi:hypothetical protein